MVSRSDVINAMTYFFPNPRYLQILSAQDDVFLTVNARYKSVVSAKFGSDAEKNQDCGPEYRLFETGSDEYFAGRARDEDKFHVVHLGGAQAFEQVLRNFTNALHVLRDDGIIVIDDVRPTSYAAALPDQGDAVEVERLTTEPDRPWRGDVYKLVYFIDTFFPALHLRTVSDTHGQSIVWRSHKASRTFAPRSFKDIGALKYIDVVKNSECFHLMSLADICADIRISRGGR